jgi:hypothetical protein
MSEALLCASHFGLDKFCWSFRPNNNWEFIFIAPATHVLLLAARTLCSTGLDYKEIEMENASSHFGYVRVP